MFTEGITRRTFVTLSATALAMGLFGCGKKEDAQGVTVKTQTAFCFTLNLMLAPAGTS